MGKSLTVSTINRNSFIINLNHDPLRSIMPPWAWLHSVVAHNRSKRTRTYIIAYQINTSIGWKYFIFRTKCSLTIKCKGKFIHYRVILWEARVLRISYIVLITRRGWFMVVLARRKYMPCIHDVKLLPHSQYDYVVHLVCLYYMLNFLFFMFYRKI